MRALAMLSIVILLRFSGAAQPWLINAQQTDYRSRPDYLRDHFAHLETLPFDGLTITTAAGRMIMSGQPLSYEQIAAEFAPLHGLIFTRMQHNFAVVTVDRPADFFADWSVTIANFRLFARALRQMGIKGLFLDNEEYFRPLFNYPNDVDDPTKSLADYQTQARLRGRQIMAAMSAEHPEMVLMAAHGPYSSFAGTPETVRGAQTDWESEELRGPFSVGLIEGADSASRFVDGGEVYAYRSIADFQDSYYFRKASFAFPETACPFLSDVLRSLWTEKVSISFGVYNLPAPSGAAMDPSILRTTLERALLSCDDYVWLYFEGGNWNAPGEIAEAWIDAVAGAQAAVSNPPRNPAPSVSITSPLNGSSLGFPRNITVTANASSAGAMISKVEFFSAATKLGEAASAPYSLAWAGVRPGTYHLMAKATDARGGTATSSVVAITANPGFEANVNFQPAGVTPPVGCLIDQGDVYNGRAHGLAYGWNFDHTANMRLRTDFVTDLRRATLCQVRLGGVWEIAVPAGTYQVTVSIGDGEFPSTHTVNVEGVSYWEAESLAANEFASQTQTVFVADGGLTVDAGLSGHEETRLNYILIASTASAPSAPTALTARHAGATAIALDWRDNSSNETHFELQRSNQVTFANAILIASVGRDETAFQDTMALAGATYYYRVRARNESAPSTFSAVAPARLPPADFDNDGVPDLEEEFPLDVAFDDRLIDSDGDGLSNAAEIATGTDPLDSRARFAFSSVNRLALSGGLTFITFEFPTSLGRRYFLDYTEPLGSQVWTRLPNSERAGDGTAQIVTDVTEAPARFYRLRLLPAN